MSRPTLLDLFCGGGGASEGYSRAGFEVTGVDVDPMPEYRHAFHQGCAIEFISEKGRDFDVIHASPPCQAYSSHVTTASSKNSRSRGKDEPMLIDAVRDLMISIGKPYIIENVVGARSSMSASLVLTGKMFGLPITRRRLFETSLLIPQPEEPHDAISPNDFADSRGWDRRDMTVTGKGRRAGTADRWREIMGIDWNLRQKQITNAIPPSFAEYIGRFYFQAITNTEHPKP